MTDTAQVTGILWCAALCSWYIVAGPQDELLNLQFIYMMYTV